MARICNVSPRMRLLKTKAALSAHTMSRIKASTSTTSSPARDTEEWANAKPLKDMPGPRGIYNIPYIGFMFHLKPFTEYTERNTHLLFHSMHDRYGPIVKIRTDRESVLLSRPEDFATVFKNEGEYPFRPFFDIIKLYYERTGFPPDLMCEKNEEWWRLKKPMHKIMMKPSNVQTYLPAMNEVGDDLVQLMKSGYFSKNGANDKLMAYSAESAGIALFNRRVRFLDDNAERETKEFLNATTTLLLAMQKTVFGSSFLFKFYQDKVYRDFEKARTLIKVRIQTIIKQAHEELKMHKKNGTFNPDEPNLLFSLLQNPELTEEEVILLMESLHLGSIDSSASVLQMIFHNLATHPDKQEKLRKEVHDVIGLDNPVTKDHLEYNMPYLKAVIRESYRFIYPLTFGTYRVLDTDIVLGGYKVPAGTQIYHFNARACLDQFEEADKFKPERWLREKGSILTEEDQKIRWSVLPFGYGKRGCSGRRIFEQELYLALAKTLQKVHIGLEPESRNMTFGYTFFIKPDRPLKFRFTSLDPQTGQLPQSVMRDLNLDQSLTT